MNFYVLVDPRPNTGPTPCFFRGMPMMKPAFECDWMRYNEEFQVALIKVINALLSGRLN